jgi:hypothetical protein
MKGALFCISEIEALVSVDAYMPCFNIECSSRSKSKSDSSCKAGPEPILHETNPTVLEMYGVAESFKVLLAPDV